MGKPRYRKGDKVKHLLTGELGTVAKVHPDVYRGVLNHQWYTVKWAGGSRTWLAEHWLEHVAEPVSDEPPAATRRGAEETDHTQLLPRESVLREAIELITGDRNNQYGPPTQDFSRTAELWTIQFRDLLKDGAKFEAHHVAEAMIQLKMSRITWSPEKRDHWTDVGGYAGNGWECVVENMPKEDDR